MSEISNSTEPQFQELQVIAPRRRFNGLRTFFAQQRLGSFGAIIIIIVVFGAVAAGYLSDRLPRWQVMSVIVALEASSLLALVLGNSWLVYVFVVVCVRLALAHY